VADGPVVPPGYSIQQEETPHTPPGYTLQTDEPQPPAGYTIADDDGTPPREPGVIGVVNRVAGNVKKGVMAAAQPFIDASAPNVAVQLYKHFKGQPNTLDKIPESAVKAFLTAGGMPEGEVPEGETAAPEADPTPTPKTPMPKAYRVLPKDGQVEVPKPPDGYQLSGESALNHYGSYLSKSDLLKLAEKRGIAKDEAADLLSKGKEVEGSGEHGELTGEDIHNNVKTQYKTQKLWDKIQDTYSMDELEAMGERANIFLKHFAGNEAIHLGKGAWEMQQMVKDRFFPELKDSI
jgi:hypothetical protein